MKLFINDDAFSTYDWNSKVTQRRAEQLWEREMGSLKPVVGQMFPDKMMGITYVFTGESWIEIA